MAAPTAEFFRRYAAEFAVHLAGRYIGRMTPRPQFSLRWMFAAITAVAVIAAEASAFAPAVALAVGLSVSLLSFAALAAGIVYARGSARAFCIGAVVSLLATRFVVVSHPPTVFALSTVFYEMITAWLATKNMNSYGIEYSLSWIFAIAGGLVAVVVRWLALRSADDEQPHCGDRV